MQIHLNGFHAGDPTISDAASGRVELQGAMPAELDVLIVGSGPAGLTLAAQLAAFPEINSRIVERKDGPMSLGQADGISCRSMEMFNAFGFGHRIVDEGYRVNEVTFWMPDASNSDDIVRVGRIQDVREGLSEMPHMILNQARVHDYYLDVMRHSPSRLQVDYQRRLTGLSVDSQADDYPVAVTLERLDDRGTVCVDALRARYVVGCDGARSSVRAAIGRELKGDYALQSWGVMDVLVVTDFPDIRLKSIVKSANEGSVIIIPREGGYLVRLYVELDSLRESGESHDTTLEQVVVAAQRIFKPYTFEVRDVAWWSVYEIGHGLTDKFDDVAEGEMDYQIPHVFIAGDACHTHSAKAGQGMNVSMGDSFNLGWKLIAVLRGKSPPQLLHTYSAERQAVAKDLVEFDHRWSRIVSAPPENSDTGDAMPLVQKHFMAGGEFTAGLRVKYQPSVLIGDGKYQHLAPGFEIGTRFHSAPVIRLADSKPVHLGHVIKADARWHLFVFAGAGDAAAADSDFTKLCTFLTYSPDSPVRRYSVVGTDPDSVICIYGILQQHHHDSDIEHMPDILKPLKGRFRIKDYEKVYCPDTEPKNDVFALRGINCEQGCVVIVRPDQYVAHVLPLDAHGEMATFFGRFMLNVA